MKTLKWYWVFLSGSRYYQIIRYFNISGKGRELHGFEVCVCLHNFVKFIYYSEFLIVPFNFRGKRYFSSYVREHQIIPNELINIEKNLPQFFI